MALVIYLALVIFEKCGFKFSITSDEKTISQASHIILPGVGAFGYAMNELKKRNLDKIIIQSAKKGINILGICLGMQLLFNESSEFGSHKGLELVKGEVVPIPSIDSLKNILKSQILVGMNCKKLKI